MKLFLLRSLAPAWVAVWCWGAATLGWANPPAASVQARVHSRGVVRVCIWPDYYGISFRDPRTGRLTGLDVDMAAELAKDLQVKVEYVDSSFPMLIQDVQTARCDVAMFGIGMLPQRVAQLQFAAPYLQSDIYAVTTRTSQVVRQWADIDKPGVLVGVQAGTFMEPVMRAHLKQAQLVSIERPKTRERELLAGRVDVFMTDYPYGRKLLDNADWAQVLPPPAPFHTLPYAYAIVQGDAQWLGTLNAFVLRIQRDGRLEAAAQRHGLASIVVRP